MGLKKSLLVGDVYLLFKKEKDIYIYIYIIYIYKYSKSDFSVTFELLSFSWIASGRMQYPFPLPNSGKNHIKSYKY